MSVRKPYPAHPSLLPIAVARKSTGAADWRRRQMWAGPSNATNALFSHAHARRKSGGALQALADGHDDVAEPAMGRMTIQPSMPQHLRLHARRVVRWLADLQRMIAHELARDPAAERRHQVRLRKNCRRRQIGRAQHYATRKPALG